MLSADGRFARAENSDKIFHVTWALRAVLLHLPAFSAYSPRRPAQGRERGPRVGARVERRSERGDGVSLARPHSGSGEQTALFFLRPRRTVKA
jgi:hypothetical protein